MRANEAAGDFGWWLARWTSSSSPTLKPGSAAFALRGKQQDGDRGGSTGLHTLDPDKNAQWLKEAKAREEALRAARLRRAAAAARPEDRPSTESLLREQVRRREEEQDYNRRYKKAARKWISTVAALPILLVTSYGLFDRCE